MVWTRSKRKAEEELLRLEENPPPRKKSRPNSAFTKKGKKPLSADAFLGRDSRCQKSSMGKSQLAKSSGLVSNRLSIRKRRRRLKKAQTFSGFYATGSRKLKNHFRTKMQCKRLLSRQSKKKSHARRHKRRCPGVGDGGGDHFPSDNAAFECNISSSASSTEAASNDVSASSPHSGAFSGDPLHIDSDGSDDSVACESSATEGSEANNDEVSLLKRVFATDRYPTDRRVNSYSKLQYLADIITILDGTPEFSTLMNSCFNSLFRLSVRRCSLSGQLLHNFLSRQVLCKNSNEMWFTFGGQPIRYSLNEFELITGLSRGPYPAQASLVAALSPLADGKPYWKELFGTTAVVSIASIVEMLQTQPQMPPLRKLRLVLVVIVDGILTCGTQPILPTVRTVEMVRDLDFFFSYPWGRLAFERTIRMIKVGRFVKTPSQLANKLKQHSLAVHGFPISIQLLLFRSVPLLLRHLPFADDEDTFLDRPVTKLPALKRYHTDNILQIENDTAFILPIITTEDRARIPVCFENDPRISILVGLINGGYKFSKGDWRGGDVSCPQLCICKKRRNLHCKCGAAEANALPSETSAGPQTVSHNASDRISKLTLEVVRLKKGCRLQYRKMKEAILREIRLSFSERQDDRPTRPVTSTVNDSPRPPPEPAVYPEVQPESDGGFDCMGQPEDNASDALVPEKVGGLRQGLRGVLDDVPMAPDSAFSYEVHAATGSNPSVSVTEAPVAVDRHSVTELPVGSATLPGVSVTEVSVLGVGDSVSELPVTPPTFPIVSVTEVIPHSFIASPAHASNDVVTKTLNDGV